MRPGRQSARNLRRRQMTRKLDYSYDIYIGAPLDQVWHGIIDGNLKQQYGYGTRLTGKWKKGSTYAYVGDGNFNVVDGEILEVQPEKKLVMTSRAHWDDAVGKDRASRVSYELSPVGPSITKLRLVHD